MCYNFKMRTVSRGQQGNIILAALCVAIFLFFLSVAMIWTNRQDIALSLSMEHKMKAEAAARTGAMSVYGALRSDGQPPSSLEQELDSGSSWKVELVRLPSEGKRGPVLLVRSRGTSGPLSSYYTLHLLETDLSSQQSADGRFLGFPSFVASMKNPGENIEQQSPSEPEAPTPEVQEGSLEPGKASDPLPAKVLYGDFEAKDIKLGVGKTLAANQGPLFSGDEVPVTKTKAFGVVTYVPAFDPMSLDDNLKLRAFGPVAVTLPPPDDSVILKVLHYRNDDFEWEDIPAAFNVSGVPEQKSQDIPKGQLDLDPPSNPFWTHVSARMFLRDDYPGLRYIWRDEEPPSTYASDVVLLDKKPAEKAATQDTIDWSAAKKTPAYRQYTLRGSIAAYGKTVYCHAWEYLYIFHNGNRPIHPMPELLGASVIRWPSVLKFDSEAKIWTQAWSPLKDNGDLRSRLLPDPNYLLVDSKGDCYSVTLKAPRKLLKLLRNGNATAGVNVPNGKIFLYQDEPYAVSSDPAKPGLLNLVSSKVIGFDTLPQRIPEISGPVVPGIEDEELDTTGTSELDPTGFAEPTTPEIRTVRNEYNLRYRVSPATDFAADGKDLYLNLEVTLTEEEPSYEKFGDLSLKLEDPITVLARFDGEHWHILPNGLMAALTKPGLGTLGNRIFCARYPGLPKAVPRYTVVSVSTNPFEFER